MGSLWVACSSPGTRRDAGPPGPVDPQVDASVDVSHQTSAPPEAGGADAPATPDRSGAGGDAPADVAPSGDQGPPDRAPADGFVSDVLLPVGMEVGTPTSDATAGTRPEGAACVKGGECASGRCAGGRCCDMVCAGYRCPSPEEACVDLNECAVYHGGCDPFATCTNLAGSRRCDCHPGYAGDGLICTAPAEPACGDGARQATEACDDGNNVAGDGCGDCRRVVQVVLGSDGSTAGHGCVRLDNGWVQCWGTNRVGELGVGDKLNTLARVGRAFRLGVGRRATALAAASSYSCALLDDGSVKCWGQGALGAGTSQPVGDDPGEVGDAIAPVDLGTGRTAKAIASSLGVTCAILDDDRLKCWGSNFSGQLGQGDRVNRGYAPGELGDRLPPIELGVGRRVRAVSPGSSHACALLDNGQVKCWGDNAVGQLGLGDERARGNDPGEMGDNLPAVDLGAGRTAVSVLASLDSSCAVLDNGVLKCWGYNRAGRLGTGTNIDYYGRHPGEMGDALPAVNLGTGRTAKALAGGVLHTCALLDDETVKCWGNNTGGELGQGDTVQRGRLATQMGDNLRPVDLGAGRRVRGLAVDRDSSCALLDDGRVKCWGRNPAGELGTGDTEARGDGPGEMGDQLPAVKVPRLWPGSLMP